MHVTLNLKRRSMKKTRNMIQSCQFKISFDNPAFRSRKLAWLSDFFFELTVLYSGICDLSEQTQKKRRQHAMYVRHKKVKLPQNLEFTFQGPSGASQQHSLFFDRDFEIFTPLCVDMRRATLGLNRQRRPSTRYR